MQALTVMAGKRCRGSPNLSSDSGSKRGWKVFNDLRQHATKGSPKSVDGNFPYEPIPTKNRTGGVVLDPGSYTASVSANSNGRSWGGFTSSSKGNNNYLDTYTFTASDQSSAFSIEVVDPELDTDGDGLPDLDEECDYGTDSTLKERH